MRELLYKNITSGNKKRKDLFLCETVERNGITTTTQRHSIYIVENTRKFDTLEELTDWKKSVDVNNKRHIFILRKRDNHSKKDTFICDVVGKFYAVNNQDIYSIAFKHTFEIDFLYAEEQ